MRILFCSDGSTEAAKAVRFGLQITHDPGNPIVLLGVVENKQEEQTIRAGLKVLEAEIEATGAAYEVKIRYGHGAEEILREAEKSRVNLIVVGRLGRRGPARFHMGSTAARV